MTIRAPDRLDREQAIGAVKAIRTLRPDLVFLDVQMPDLDGFQVLTRLAPEPAPQVVFVTAYDEFAVRAFEVHALDYLVKPFTDERFEIAFARIRERPDKTGAEAAAKMIGAATQASAPLGHFLVRVGRRWRLGPPGGVARPLGELVPVFVPALRAILLALEAKAEAPLTQEQVETTRDEGACIAMEPRHAQALERSRGYADFDPELVWEQWKLVAAR